MSSEVDDRVVVEHDRVVARRRCRPGWRSPGRARRPRGRSRAASIVRRVDRALLGVAGAVVGAHRHREQLARRPALGGADALGRWRPRPPRRPCENEPKAVTPASSAAAMTARAPSARSSGLAVGRARRTSRRGAACGAIGLGQAGPVLELLDVRGDRRGPLDERADALGVDAARCSRRRPGGPSTNRRLTNTSALATFWWISRVGEPGQRGLAADDQRLGLARAGGLGRLDDLLGEAQRVLRIAADAVRRRSCHHPHPDVPEPRARDAVADVAGLARLALAAVRRAPHRATTRRRRRRPSTATART